MTDEDRAYARRLIAYARKTFYSGESRIDVHFDQERGTVSLDDRRQYRRKTVA